MNLLKLLSLINHRRLNLRHARQLRKRKSLLKKFGDFVRYLVVETPQGKYIVDPSDASVARALMVDGSYGGHEVDALREYLDQNSNVILLGGHIGSVAIPISKIVRSVHVFEANPVNFELLRMNVSINSCSNVKLYNLAISDGPGEIDFFLHEGNSGASRRAPLYDYEPVAFEKGVKTTIKADSLDNVFQDFHEDIDLLFMDIEGSEYFAVKGGSEILKRTKVLVTEFFPGHFRLVADKSPLDFWSLFSHHFDKMIIPSESKIYRGLMEIEDKIKKIDVSASSYDNVIFLR